MSVGSGYLWLCLKFNNLNLVSLLISLLIKTNQLSELSAKRKQIKSRYRLDSFNTLIVALIFVTFSVFAEGLLALPPTLYQYVYLLNYATFYFFLGLAIVQKNSNLDYLISRILLKTSCKIDRLNGAFLIIKFGVSNISKLIFLTLLIPLLYANKPMMISEVAIVTIFMILAICGPIRKTWRLYCVWRADKRRISDKTDEIRYNNQNIEVSIDSNTVDTSVKFTHKGTRDLLEIKKYVASLSLIILLWFLVIILNK